MALRLGDIAPNFAAQTSIGPIDFYKYLGNSWGVLLPITHLFVQQN